MRDLNNLIYRIHNCSLCGKSLIGYSACGFGKTDQPLVMFIGINPWVNIGFNTFKDGRGITILKRYLKEWKFENFFFDNIIKCQMKAEDIQKSHIDKCFTYLQEQIAVIQPKNIIAFGHIPQYELGQRLKTDIPIHHFPHFSSYLWVGGEEKYYKKLKILLEELK